MQPSDNESAGPSSSASSNHPDTATTNTRGRKRKSVPASEKDRRNLENQRNFRKRQQNRMSTLERENESLKAQLLGHLPVDSFETQHRITILEAENALLRQSSVAIDLKASFQPGSRVGDCATCAVEKTKCLVIGGMLHETEGKVAALERENALLKKQNSNLRAVINNIGILNVFCVDTAGTSMQTPLIGIDPVLADICTPSTTQVEMRVEGARFVCATQLFGQPDTEWCRNALKSLNSLCNSPLVDELMEMFEKLSLCTDIAKLKRYSIRGLYIRSKLLDECANVIERQTAVELLLAQLLKNREHVQYCNSMFEVPLASGSPPVSPTILAPLTKIPLPPPGVVYRDQLLAIQSLQNSPNGHSSVHEFCSLFWNKDHKKGNNEETLIQLLTVAKRMERICLQNLDDRTKFSLTGETWRQGNRAQLEEMYADVDADSDGE
ncbi:hypothetical protein HDU98_002907 [Podochytrium sp. JEL0797]|nr:hypothetical protein HDU98_002907 [Podochytrium sp. JEL0797]